MSQDVRTIKTAEKAKKFAHELLVNRLVDISEKHWCCGWCINTEYVVWRVFLRRNFIAIGGKFGQLWEPDLLNQIDDASLACGWVSWDEETGKCVHVPMDDWRRKYEAWLEKR